MFDSNDAKQINDNSQRLHISVINYARSETGMTYHIVEGDVIDPDDDVARADLANILKRVLYEHGLRHIYAMRRSADDFKAPKEITRFRAMCAWESAEENTLGELTLIITKFETVRIWIFDFDADEILSFVRKS